MVVLFATAAAVLAGVLAALAQATAPGTNGRIAFERLRPVGPPPWGELFVMNSDGSDVQKITHPPNGTEDTNPDWSPDGSRIVFAARRRKAPIRSGLCAPMEPASGG